MTATEFLNRIQHIHLVGVGGAGMSALAKLLSGQGWKITGSDLRHSPTLGRLSDLGIEVWSGHQPQRLGAAQLVVSSSAVPSQDPELEFAHTQSIPVWKRPQLLSAISGRQPTIGASGSHGKTTTTALLAEIFRAAGHAPSIVLGAEMISWGTNAVVGSDPLLILEVDEAFSTFTGIQLSGLVVTNVGDDHLDHFGGSTDMLESAFVEVVRGVQGPVLVCRDDPGSTRVAERCSVLTYGRNPDSDFQITHLTSHTDQVTFVLNAPDGVRVQTTVGGSGLHLGLNAAGALSLAITMGISPEHGVSGISNFGGVRRRFEHKGTVADIKVVDDYAHHPTEIYASLQAGRSSHSGRIITVFQPHLFSRTARLAGELGQSLSGADIVLVTDVFGSRETPIPGVTGELVAEAVSRAGGQVYYLAARQQLLNWLQDHTRPGDLVLTLGAGDIGSVAEQLVRALGQKLEEENAEV